MLIGSGPQTRAERVLAAVAAAPTVTAELGGGVDLPALPASRSVDCGCGDGLVGAAARRHGVVGLERHGGGRVGSPVTPAPPAALL